jgi:hypothetical protein
MVVARVGLRVREESARQARDGAWPGRQPRGLHGMTGTRFPKNSHRQQTPKFAGSPKLLTLYRAVRNCISVIR